MLACAAQDSLPRGGGSAEIEEQLATDKRPLANAEEIYAQKFPNPKSGLFFTDDLAFVVVVIEKASLLDSDQLEKKCLLEALRILREAEVDSKHQQAFPPQSNALLDTFVFLKDECRKADPLFATRRLNLEKLESRVIENKFLEMDFRQCIALKAGDFRQALSEAAPPTIAATVDTLRRRLVSLEENPEALSELWKRLGAVDEVLNLANEESWLDWPMNSYGESSGDSLDLLRMLGMIDDDHAGQNRSAADLRRALQALPGLPKCFAELARKSSDSKDFEKALNFLLLSRIEGNEKLKPKELIARWQSQCAATSPKLSESLEEFEELFEKIKLNGLSVDESAHPAFPIIRRSWNTLGSVNPPKKATRLNLDRAASWERKEDEKWPEGNVLDLFYGSVCDNPRSPVAWKEFGVKAKESGNLELATVCLRQAIRLGSDDVQSRMLLAQCYRDMGFRNLFLTTALAAALVDADLDSEREAACQLLASALAPSQ